MFCDISKAFDKAFDNGLIQIEKKKWISGRLLALFVDYLKDRHQRAVIRGQQSEIGQIKVGVPEGSV